jgi:hypothetical protein
LGGDEGVDRTDALPAFFQEGPKAGVLAGVFAGKWLDGYGRNEGFEIAAIAEAGAVVEDAEFALGHDQGGEAQVGKLGVHSRGEPGVGTSQKVRDGVGIG